LSFWSFLEGKTAMDLDQQKQN